MKRKQKDDDDEWRLVTEWRERNEEDSGEKDIMPRGRKERMNWGDGKTSYSKSNHLLNLMKHISQIIFP
jgi:hypothetical protein